MSSFSILQSIPTFVPPTSNGAEIESISTSSFLDSMLNDFGPMVLKVYEWGIVLITAGFVIGALVMILSALFKNGQWQKFGQNTMFWSFLTILLLRAGPILSLSIQSSNDMDSLLREFIITLSYSAIFIGAISVVASGLFRLGHRLIEHPEFYRRSKTLMMVSVLMMIFSLAIPNIFPLI